MIVDFNKQNGGGVDLSKYWTSAQTESAIEQATEDLVTSGEVQTMIDDSISGISIDLSDYWTSAQTESAIDEAISEIVIPDVSDYWTSAQTQEHLDEINVHIDDFERVTSIALNELHSEMPDVSNYITSGDVNTLIQNALSGILSDIAVLSGKVQQNELITATALNNLDNRINELSGTTV